MKIHAVGAELFYADGQMNRHVEIELLFAVL
jgi:hypothetical protein